MGKRVGTYVLYSSISYIILYYDRELEKSRLVCEVQVQYTWYYIIIPRYYYSFISYCMWSRTKSKQKPKRY